MTNVNNTQQHYASAPHHTDPIVVKFSNSVTRNEQPPAHTAYGGYAPAPGGYAYPQPAAGGYGGGGGYGAPAAESPKLFVGNLPLSATEAELQGIFAQYGTVEEVRVLPPKGSRGHGCAFVTYTDVAAATAAIAAVNGNVCGFASAPTHADALSVKFASSAPRTGGPGGAMRAPGGYADRRSAPY